jgi:hypothetical protein
MGRCDPGDQILLKNSKCLEWLQIEQERRPHHHEPNATHLGSNGRQMRERYRILFKMTNRQKKCADCTVRTDADVANRTTRGRAV